MRFSTSTATASTLNFIPPVPVVDVLNAAATTGVTVSRGSLDAGTLTASIASVALDPATNDLLRTGRATRLQALDASGEWRRLYTGSLDVARTDYPLLANAPDDRKALISINASDALSVLAAATRTESVATIDELPFVLEGVAVPWSVNGSGDQVASATVRARSDNTTALDQIALTRDTASGYAWVDRLGIIQVWDADEMPTAPTLTLDEDVYGPDLQVSFDSATCINDVTVTVRSLDGTGATIETTTNYTDAASIRQWGRYDATFTVLAPTNPATFAAAVLAANANPGVRITSLSVNIRDASRLPYAFLDLCELVHLENTDLGISEDARITSVTHTIEPEKWIVTYTFGDPGGVAAPQVVPPVQQGANSEDWTAVSFNATHAGDVKTRIKDGVFYITGYLSRSSGATGSFVAAGVINTPVPAGATFLTNTAITGATIRAAITGGNLTVNSSTSAFGIIHLGGAIPLDY